MQIVPIPTHIYFLRLFFLNVSFIFFKEMDSEKEKEKKKKRERPKKARWMVLAGSRERSWSSPQKRDKGRKNKGIA